MNEFFELGRILKPRGIKGEVKTEFFTDDLSRVDYLDFVYFKHGQEMSKVDICSKRISGSYVYLHLFNVSDRNDAEKLRGQIFYIDRANAAPLPEGSFYISDLIGLEVRDDKGFVLGVLKDILQYGSADIYCVEGESRFMFPAVPDIFIERAPEKGYIVVSCNRLSEVMIDDI